MSREPVFVLGVSGPVDFVETSALAVDRYLSSCRHVELLRAVEVEFLAGDLSVAGFEREIERWAVELA